MNTQRAARFLACTVVAAVGVVPAQALAKPKVADTYPVTGVGTNNQITLGPDGNMWVTLDQTDYLARITPGGTVTQYKPAAFTAAPIGITRAGQFLWATQLGAVVRVDPNDPANATKFAINAIADPRAITLGPDGNLWTASGDKVIKIPPDNPAGFTAYAATGVEGARWITRGRDGTLWVADFGGQQIVNVTTAGVGTEYATGGGPQGVAAGPGKQVAYSNPQDNPQTVGRITVGGTAQERTTPMKDPFGVAFGADRSYWIAQFAGNNLGRLSVTGEYRQLGGLPANSGPRQLTTGRNRTVWVTLDTSERIAKVTGLRPPVPNTTITKRPADVVTTNTNRTRVRFRFTSSIAGSSFQCRLKRKGTDAPPFRGCESPKRYRLKQGKYVFSVRARAAGIQERTPAVDRFRIVRS